MSKEALAKVVQRAISDGAFRRQLSSDPGTALRGFDLTADESAAFGLISVNTVASAMARATLLYVKSIEEGFGVPTAEGNAASVRATADFPADFFRRAVVFARAAGRRWCRRALVFVIGPSALGALRRAR